MYIYIYILICIDHVDKQTKTYVHVKCTRKSDPNFFLEYINFKVPISLRPLSLFKVHCTFSTKCILKHIFLQCSLEMLFVSSVIILFYFTLNLKKLYGQLGLIWISYIFDMKKKVESINFLREKNISCLH